MLRMVSTNGLMCLSPSTALTISTASSPDLDCCAVRAAGEETILHPRRLRQFVCKQPTDPTEYDHRRQSNHGATAGSIFGALSHADISSRRHSRQFGRPAPMMR
jgi:hypothetical protein